MKSSLLEDNKKSLQEMIESLQARVVVAEKRDEDEQTTAMPDTVSVFSSLNCVSRDCKDDPSI
eukprot:3332535-Amphidinium_carterae.1